MRDKSAGIVAYPHDVATELHETSDASLDVTDRCDRCGARAKTRVRLAAGELYLCGHHFAQHAEALAKLVHVPRSL